MARYPQIALVFKTRLEENVRILNAIGDYNRLHLHWTAFVDDQAIAQQSAEWLLRKEWAGIICKHTAPDLLTRARDRGIPCVDCSDDPRAIDGVPKVRPDNIAIGHAGAEHFIEKGYVHFGFCGFSSEAWACTRRDGFVEAVRLVGGNPYIFEDRWPKASNPLWEDDEEHHIREWLQDLPKPVAVMGCNDMRALQVVNACRLVDLQIPEEVAVIGANNDTVRCELSQPQLSSIATNARLYGQLAARTLADLMQGQEPEETDILIPPMDPITRRSTDGTAIDDPKVAQALSLIRDGACNGITVDSVVTRVGVSRSVLERRFRKYLGRSPQVEIRSFQVRRIRQLLLETDYGLVRIADLAGFDHPEYMCVVFKRITGKTPTEFRRSQQLPA